MDYEKKYKDALSHAKQAYGTGAYDDSTLEAIFPELAENEDERIRKELISQVEKSRHHPADKARWIAWLEKQKEQKTIIQDVELNDAVYDYVRDHFIAGADFTPEYIKKLMENAFFAGVDYYLLKQESESCEPDTNVEKVIEDVIRVYGKTQGEWVGGYDVDTLIVNLRRAFNKKEHKDPHYTKRNALFDKCVENCGPKTVEEVNKRVDDIMNMPKLSPFEQALTNFIGDWTDDEEHWPSQFVKKHGKHILDIAREELQKEQKPSSKFRPGDWVVYDGPLGHAILQIKDVVDGRYSFVDNESTLLVEDSDKFLRPLTPKDVEKLRRRGYKGTITKVQEVEL